MSDEELPWAPTKPKGELVWIAGGDFDRVTVSLRFFGDDLDPDEVTALLQCEPTAAHRKGDTLIGKDYRRVAKTGMWRLGGGSDETDLLQDHIANLLNRVSGDLAVWDKLKPFKGDVFCGLTLKRWNRGGNIPPELMRRLAERHLFLNLDIYYHGDDDGQE